MADLDPEVFDAETGEIDWNKVYEETWWLHESKSAGKDLVFFRGG